LTGREDNLPNRMVVQRIERCQGWRVGWRSRVERLFSSRQIEETWPRPGASHQLASIPAGRYRWV